MSLDFGLRDVHVLITGAAGGIGLDTVRTFVDLGARVTAHWNSKKGEALEVLEREGRIKTVRGDVRDEEQVERIVSGAREGWGEGVGVLVVNHGIWPENDTPVADMSLAQWANTLAINLTGPFLLCRAYLRALRAAPTHVQDVASIVFIGSTAGKFGEALHADYATSKAALMYGLLPTLKNEIVRVAPRGRVNAVSPGWVVTPLSEKTLEDRAFVERALATTPLQKVGTTRDVARQVAVLASPVLSGHVSGVNVMVDGGMEGRLLFPPQSSTT